MPPPLGAVARCGRDDSAKGLPEGSPFWVFGLQAALDVGGVQDLVSLVAIGGAEELIVDLLNSQVVLGGTNVGIRIVVVEDGGADSAQIHVHTDACGLNGLTAAVDATAGTSHDLDELDIQLAVLDHVQEFLSVTGTGGNEIGRAHV